MERYICIHGHFYQPPRENAWLEYVETQDSAYPFHDWNERVTAESYGPNSASRILDERGRVAEICNNYAKISFDFGPTLLSWLETSSPDTYQAIIESDKESMRNFGGHGSAIAQAYSHLIMPLANRRDKITQVIWGIRDFEHRFGRKPEGMWLPETAVDNETLDIMAGQGVKFTILSPHQAAKIRRIGTRHWRRVPGNIIDPSMAYQINLPSGRKLAVFFYDGPVSHAIAFEDILQNGDNFARRLASSFSEKRTWPQLMHIATDGETYGHHRRFGDMALAYALRQIERNKLARLTNYGEYLANHPPTYEVAINENTSWSCAHGVERWRSNCGCRIGTSPAWNQVWRAPLRASMDWLRDALAPEYQKMAVKCLKNPWLARDDYIDVILDRSPEKVNKFLAEHCRRKLNQTEEVTVLKLLEMQRHAMLMYTSCGWFFDELSGIEAVQIMQYAGRAAQLADELFAGSGIESALLDRLSLAKSNVPEQGDGRRIYEKFVRPAGVDLSRVAAHLAVSSLFENYARQADVYCYQVNFENYHSRDCGKGKLSLGQATITSTVTRESANISFGAFNSGGDNVSATVGEAMTEDALKPMVSKIVQACKTADFSKVSRLLIEHLSSPTYTINDLFPDERRRLLDRVLGKAISEIEAAYHQMYGHYYPMGFAGTNVFPPNARQAANFLLNSGLRLAFTEDPLRLERIRHLLQDAREWHTELDTVGLSYLVQRLLEKMMGRFAAAPQDAALRKDITAAAEMLPALPFPVDLWKVQALYYRILKADYPSFQKMGDKTGEWLEQFVLLGQRLSMDV